jgi:peptide/nickel transport system permease protein
MLGFVVRRLLAMIVVIFVITVLVFLLFFHTPGVDPARKLAGRNPSPETIKAIKHAYGLDRPLPVQYVILMKKLFITRDLTSYSNQGELVMPAIVAATLSLVFGAALIWVVVAMLMGVAAALLRGTIFDPLLMVLALIGISMPVFWLGEMANLVTQSRYHDTILFSWVPPLGYTPFAQAVRALGRPRRNRRAVLTAGLRVESVGAYGRRAHRRPATRRGDRLP